MPLPEENELPELNPAFGDDSDQKQRRQMLIALALLLLALILVLVKDREFWFPPTPATAAESELAEPTETDTQSKDQAQGQANRPPAQPSHHRLDVPNPDLEILSRQLSLQVRRLPWRRLLPAAPCSRRSRLRSWPVMSIGRFRREQTR